MRLPVSRTIRIGRVISLTWGLAVAELSLTSGWFSAQLSSSATVRIAGGLGAAMVGGGVPLATLWRTRRGP